MDNFFNEIETISKKNNKIAMFIDMDGTIVEYKVYTDEEFPKKTEGKFENGRPLQIILDKLKKISKFGNVDLFILSLARNSAIVEEKKKWLKKYAPFIKEENWIILNREIGDYTKQNREEVKTNRMKEKLNTYNHLVFLDDDHPILRKAKTELKEKINVFHISSAII